MSPPRAYRNFAEFEREFIRPAFRVGQTFEDMVQDNPFEAELDFDRDPYEQHPSQRDDDDY